MHEEIISLIHKLEKQENLISETRKNQLDKLIQYFSGKKEKKESILPLIVCTHNSRRSHIGQLWFAVGADYYQVAKLRSYSAGTMATELNGNVVRALKSVGFNIELTEQAKSNQPYLISWSEENTPVTLFSKEYMDKTIPKEGVAAIMVCTDADENCPFIPGAEMRFSLPFEDPKASDGTPNVESRYLESIHEIGREVIYILKNV